MRRCTGAGGSIAGFWDGMILQGGRGDRRPMRLFKNAMGKGNGRVEPVPGNANIAVLPVQPVNLHPVNKPVTRPAANICQHQLPGVQRASGAQFNTPDGALDPSPAGGIQRVGIVIENRF